MNASNVSRFFTIAVASLSLFGCNGVEPGADPGEITEALTGPTQVATTLPTGLVESTGNLYWTSRGAILFPRRTFTATVWRAGKNNVPGQEVALYSEQSSFGFSFGDLTYAQVGGVWYGFFSVNYNATSAAIKRIPLTGGAAVTLATVTSPIGRRISTDGQNIYFGDSTGLRFCSVYGGGADTLAAPGGAVIGASYVPYHVYFATANTVYDYNTYFQSLSTFDSSTHPPITDFYAGTTGPTIVYSDQFGVIARRPNSNNPFVLYGAPPVGHLATSVSFDGTNVLYTECATNKTACTTDIRPYTGNGFTGTTVNVNDGASFVNGDAAQVFYGTNAGLFKITY